MTDSILLKNRSFIFKGEVTSNSGDPLNLNRVQVWIPQLHGEQQKDREYPWASCIVMSNQIPPVGAKVAVGFEGNDYNSPIIFGIYSSDTEHLNAIGGQGGVEGQYAGGSLAEIAAKIIFSNEGSYDSVAWNDHDCLAKPKNFTSSCTCGHSKNGAISIGKIQWHANRARNLLIKIREKNQSKFDEICNKRRAGGLIFLLNESTSWGGMRNWSESCPIGKAIKEILGTEESKQAQDEQAIEDVQKYLDTAKSGGITDPACLIYLADIINQYGSCPSLVNSGINNLDELYKFSLANGYGAYEPRRTSTYNAIKKIEAEGKLTPEQLSDMAGDLGTGLIGWPTTKGPVTSEFYRSSGAFHGGIDIGVPVGTPIASPLSGTCLALEQNGKPYGYDTIDDNLAGYGYYQIVIADAQINGVWYGVLMAHESIKGKSGKVKKGEIIGKSGNTGNSSGAHIHFEIRTLSNGSPTSSNFFAGTKKDPKQYLDKKYYRK